MIKLNKKNKQTKKLIIWVQKKKHLLKFSAEFWYLTKGLSEH